MNSVRDIYAVSDGTDVAAVGTSFDAAKLTTINMNSVSAIPSPGRFMGRIEAIIVKLKSISSATQITVKGVAASTPIIPDTTADIALDVGSSTAGAVVYRVDLDWVYTDDEIKIYCKTDVGTVTVDSVTVVWSK